MARLDLFTGQIPGQLEIPDEIVRGFRLPGSRWGRDWQLDVGHTVTHLPTYHADGRGATKYRPVHWHDWTREQTRPWRRPPDRDVAWLLAQRKTTPGKYAFDYESTPYEKD